MSSTESNTRQAITSDSTTCTSSVHLHSQSNVHYQELLHPYRHDSLPPVSLQKGSSSLFQPDSKLEHPARPDTRSRPLVTQQEITHHRQGTQLLHHRGQESQVPLYARRASHPFQHARHSMDSPTRHVPDTQFSECVQNSRSFQHARCSTHSPTHQVSDTYLSDTYFHDLRSIHRNRHDTRSPDSGFQSGRYQKAPGSHHVFSPPVRQKKRRKRSHKAKPVTGTRENASIVQEAEEHVTSTPEQQHYEIVTSESGQHAAVSSEQHQCSSATSRLRRDSAVLHEEQNYGTQSDQRQGQGHKTFTKENYISGTQGQGHKTFTKDNYISGTQGQGHKTFTKDNYISGTQGQGHKTFTKENYISGTQGQGHKTFTKENYISGTQGQGHKTFTKDNYISGTQGQGHKTFTKENYISGTQRDTKAHLYVSRKSSITSVTISCEFWRECILNWYPDLHKQAYFVPPMFFKRVPYSHRSVAGQSVLLAQEADDGPPAKSPKSTTNKRLNRVLDKDVREDRAQERVLISLQALADKHKSVMMVISQMQFNKYLNKSSHALTSHPRPADLDPSNQQGDFDLLIIHSQYGLIVGEIKSVGGYSNISTPDACTTNEKALVKKVEDALKQLKKAETVLTHITSDMGRVRIVKTLILPNTNYDTLKKTLSRYPKTEEDFRSCFGVKTTVDALKLCLLADQLTPFDTPFDFTEYGVKGLEEWWCHRVAVDDPNQVMTLPDYDELVARFCGPATTHEIFCVTSPRLELRTYGEGVAETGNRLASLVLYPDQLEILTSALPLVFLCGPPGTGKTVVLVLQGLEWLRQNYKVHIVSVIPEGNAAAILIETQLQNTMPAAKSKVCLHNFNLWITDNVHSATSSVLHESRQNEQLHVIIDEAGPNIASGEKFKQFCSGLVDRLPALCLWSAGLEHTIKPRCLVEKKLTVPVRCPPAVVREVCKSKEIRNVLNTYAYSPTNIPAPADGPFVRQVVHTRGQSGHTYTWARDCMQCGFELWSKINELYVHLPVIGARPSKAPNTYTPLLFSDVLVLCDDPHDEEDGSEAIGLVRGLRKKSVPVRVLPRGSSKEKIRQVLLAKESKVTVSHWEIVQGLEWKIVVVTKDRGLEFNRLRAMSRCTSQLILIEEE